MPPLSQRHPCSMRNAQGCSKARVSWIAAIHGTPAAACRYWVFSSRQACRWSPVVGNVVVYRSSLSWFSLFSHIFLVERDKHDDARRQDGENHHEVYAGSTCDQHPAQSHPQEQDASEAYDIASSHNLVKNCLNCKGNHILRIFPHLSFFFRTWKNNRDTIFRASIAVVSR